MILLYVYHVNTFVSETSPPSHSSDQSSLSSSMDDLPLPPPPPELMEDYPAPPMAETPQTNGHVAMPTTSVTPQPSSNVAPVVNGKHAVKAKGGKKQGEQIY